MTENKTNKFSRGKIYKLVNSNDNLIYVGSTCCSLPQRYYLHKTMAAAYPERKSYQHLNTVGWRNVRIELLQAFPCTSQDELRTREAHWQNELRPALNKNSVIDDCSHGRVKSRCKDCVGSSGYCMHRRQNKHCNECSTDRVYCYVCSRWCPNSTAFLYHTRTAKHNRNEGLAMDQPFQ